VKVGDLVTYQWGVAHDPKHPDLIGTVLDFPPASHAKEFQKVRVLTESGVKAWMLQYCKKV